MHFNARVVVVSHIMMKNSIIIIRYCKLVKSKSHYYYYRRLKICRRLKIYSKTYLDISRFCQAVFT